MQEMVIGVDLGGTNVRAGAFGLDGLAAGPSFSNSSRAEAGLDATIEAIATTVEQAVSAAGGGTPRRVGLAIPGHVDDARGMVRWAPNFGRVVNGVFLNWRDVPVRDHLSRRLGGVPVTMGNDANLAALGEYRFGSGRNEAACLVMLTLGTGVGGGVVMRPQAVQGDARGPLVLVGGNGGGAELGHVIVQAGGAVCNAGSYGAIEAYCARDAIVERAVHRLKRGRDSILREWTDGDYSHVTPKLISEACAQGDATAIEVYREVGEYLGVAMGSFINIFAPDVLAVGGQIAKAGEFVLGPAREAARNVAIPSLFSDVRIGEAELLEDAGLLGAAAVALA